jgi:phenylacetate-CoA ligase
MKPVFELECWMKRFYRHGPRFKQYLNHLEKTQRLSQDGLQQYQQHALQRMVRHCYREVPYYQEIFRELKLTPDDIRSADDLQALPLLDKQTVNANFDTLVAKRHKNFLCRTGMTSGTNGSPGKFLRDFNSINFEHAAAWRYWRGAGDYGKKRASLRGGIIVPVAQMEPPFWRYNPANRELQMSSFHLSMTNSAAYVNELLDFQPEVLYCLPSLGQLLAKFFRHHQVNYRFDAIFTSSESLEPDVRRYIEEVFQCRVYDWYGQAERVAAIGQCRHGHYHIQEDYSIVELLPGPEDGCFELVGTQLQNWVMPLLRYRTQDYVYMHPIAPQCPCGSHFRIVDTILGRSGNFIVTPEGCKVSITAHIPCGVDNLLETQFVQEDQHEVKLNIVTNGCFTEQDKEKLIQNTHKFTSPNIKVTITEVPEIPRGPNGKFISVINKLDIE